MMANSLLQPPSTKGLDPGLSAVVAALRLNEREEGPMPDRVSYIKNFCYQEEWAVLTTSVNSHCPNKLRLFWLSCVSLLCFISPSLFCLVCFLKWPAKQHVVVWDLPNFGGLATVPG